MKMYMSLYLVSEKMMQMTKKVLDGHGEEKTTVVAYLRGVGKGNDSANPLEIEVELTPVEALDLKIVASGSKEMTLSFSEDFSEKASASLEEPKHKFDASGQMRFEMEDGRTIIWPFRMKNLEVMSFSKVKDGFLVLTLMQWQENNGENHQSFIQVKGDLEKLLFVAE